MADNSYSVEVNLASKNGWHTPAEARAYYGRYDRSGITVHWWGDGTGADNHDNIVNYMNREAAAGNKSVNYVLSDNKITLSVSPDNVAWCSNSGNPTTISVETQPTLGDEGYKKWGWLVDQLEQRYERSLPLYPHSYWNSTSCPGSISLDRIRAEADKWKRGEYDAKPAPTPQPLPPAPTPVEPSKVTLEITDIPNKLVRVKTNTNLWNLGFKKYADAVSVKTLANGEVLEASAIAKHPLGSSYYLTEYSYAKGISNGFNVKDCEDVVAEPTPVTPLIVTPPVVEPPKPIEVPVVTEHDKAQDAKINAIETLLQKIVDFLSSVFSGFKK